MHWIITVLLAIYTPILLSAQPAPTLQEAIEKGWVRAEVTASGGHSGPCISLRLERLTPKPFRLIIPAGLVFEPTDTARQPLVNLREESLSLGLRPSPLPLYAVCADAPKQSPAAADGFRLGRMATGALLQVVQFISKNGLENHSDAQDAVWAVTNGHSVAGIGHPGLQTATCLALGIPKPEYRLVREKTQRPPTAGRPAAESYKPLRVEGKFLYQSNTDKTLNAYVVNEQGTTVKTIFKDRVHRAGWAEYSFMFETSRLPRGKYEVHLHDGGGIVKKIHVTY